jgi:hypothetical protein
VLVMQHRSFSILELQLAQFLVFALMAECATRHKMQAEVLFALLKGVLQLMMERGTRSQVFSTLLLVAVCAYMLMTHTQLRVGIVQHGVGLVQHLVSALGSQVIHFGTTLME